MEALVVLGAALWLAAPCAAAAGRRPTELGEMRARRIVAPDSSDWTEEQSEELRRMRRAEYLGAVDYLKENAVSLGGAFVELPSGEGFKRTLLTEEGYQRWLFTLSQDARGFFERHGADAAYVFEVKDASGTRLFDGDGLLTETGVDLFLTAKHHYPVFWRNPDGTMNGTQRPPAEGPPPAAPA
ncbi:MAG: hypothetical protein KGL53_16540, partial [Elusimicrobia bacterium]|nr:hypothetical protein [Elusimicrobiota bacterium]